MFVTYMRAQLLELLSGECSRERSGKRELNAGWKNKGIRIQHNLTSYAGSSFGLSLEIVCL